METELKMPDLATTDSAVKVVRWLVEAGQVIKRGQPLLEVETDKASMEVESVATGTLKQLFAQPGDEIVTGQRIASVEVEGEGISPPPDVPVKQASADPLPIAGTPARTGGMFAKNRAAQRPVQAGSTPSIPLTLTQRTVGQRMVESKQNVPHFYLQTSINAEPMIRRRGEKKTAWDAFFVHAVGKALKKHERMAFQFAGDHLVHSGADAAGVAVSHEDELYVIAIAAPGDKSPEKISDEIRVAVAALRAGGPDARKLRPASITVSNLGASNVTTFTAIVNPPQAAILAVGKVAPVAVVHEGNIIPQHRVSITLSVDHRVVNGKYAADFLDTICAELESL